MNEKKAKEIRREQNQKVVESQERQKQFMKEVQALSEKYRIDLVATVQYRQTGIIPAIVLVDVKDKYEQMTAEAKKIEESKKQAQNPNVNNPVDVPKLEL